MNALKSIRLKHKLRRFFSLAPYNYYEYLKHELLTALSKSFFKKYLKNTEIKKLQIGCGYNLLDGWLNTDLTYKKGEIGFLDASKTFPFENDSFDYIYSEHIFEHLNFKQELNMLTECFRILKPNGVMRLATPNMQFLFDLYLNPNDDINKEYIDWSLENFDIIASYNTGGRYSFIPWHDDGNHAFSVTVYLNQVWDRDWAGYFMYERNGSEDIAAILPSFNRAVLFRTPLLHSVSMPNVNAPLRCTLQVFFKEKKCN